MHIHITQATYKLLDRKIYEFQERSRSVVNGSISMNTYFVLNKKDRLGNSPKHPFHLVLEQRKNQELKEAKQRQSDGFKDAQRNSLIKEDGFHLSNHTPISKSTEFTLVSSRTDVMNSEHEKSQYVQTNFSKSVHQPTNNSQTHALKPCPVLSNSKTCTLF